MKRSFTSDIASHESDTKHATSTKIKLQNAIEYVDYLTRNNLIHIKQRAFDFFKMSRRSDQRILIQIDNENSDQEAAESAKRIIHNSKFETRREQYKIQSYHVRRMKKIINFENIKQRAFS